CNIIGDNVKGLVCVCVQSKRQTSYRNSAILTRQIGKYNLKGYMNHPSDSSIITDSATICRSSCNAKCKGRCKCSFCVIGQRSISKVDTSREYIFCYSQTSARYY